MIDRILVVCTGNVCRSPIAQAMLAQALPRCAVSSAGTAALVGYPADPVAVAAARAQGLDIRAHRARQVEQALLQQNDLVLAVERRQVNWMENRFPAAKGRVFLLSHWSDETDVPDPFGRDIGDFRDTIARLRPYINDWVWRLAPGAARAVQ